MKSFISSIIALALCSSSWYANWINSGSPGIIEAKKEVIWAHFIVNFYKMGLCTSSENLIRPVSGSKEVQMIKIANFDNDNQQIAFTKMANFSVICHWLIIIIVFTNEHYSKRQNMFSFNNSKDLFQLPLLIQLFKLLSSNVKTNKIWYYNIRIITHKKWTKTFQILGLMLQRNETF